MRRAILLAALLLATAAHAAPVKRRVLALHKGSEGDTAYRNLTVALLEQPLESLGLVVDHLDIEKGLPGDAEMDAYRGVVTYFRAPAMPGAAAYADWVRRQAAAGRRFVIFGEFGALQEKSTGEFLTHDQVNAAFRAIGLSFDGFGTTNPALIRLVNASDGMSFEEPFTESAIDAFIQVKALTRAATPYLTLERTDIRDGRGHPVVATPSGGFANGSLILHEYEQTGRLKQRWHLDPYSFLSDALGVRSAPRMDAASLNGRRLWMAHIDGDGFLTPADPGRLCGQAMLEEVLSVIDLPVTVSVITSDIAADRRAPDIARRIFARPNIEAASHSRSHPMDWRARGVDAGREVTDSIAAINGGLMPAGKSARVITWTGLCNPPAAAIQAAEALGVANMNGINDESGFVNRFDPLYPSRTHLAPMTRTVGGMPQFSHLAANDYEYTDRWTDGRLADFRNVIETFERTSDLPERPAHVYFHFYSAHEPEALKSLLAVLEWSKTNPLNRVFVSDYVKIVEDFRSARLTRDADGRILVHNAGHCRTLVIPGASRRHVDFGKSEHVVGYAPRGDALYVFLDETRDHAVALSDERPARPFLASAEGGVDAWTVNGATASFELRGFGLTGVAIAVPSGGTYALVARPLGFRSDRREFTAVARAVDGVVSFQVPATGHDMIFIQPTGPTRTVADSLRYPVLAISLAAFPIWFFARARRRLIS